MTRLYHKVYVTLDLRVPEDLLVWQLLMDEGDNVYKMTLRRAVRTIGGRQVVLDSVRRTAKALLSPTEQPEVKG